MCQSSEQPEAIGWIYSPGNVSMHLLWTQSIGRYWGDGTGIDAPIGWNEVSIFICIVWAVSAELGGHFNSIQLQYWKPELELEAKKREGLSSSDITLVSVTIGSTVVSWQKTWFGLCIINGFDHVYPSSTQDHHCFGNIWCCWSTIQL